MIVAADIPVTEIVREDINDVGALRGRQQGKG